DDQRGDGGRPRAGAPLPRSARAVHARREPRRCGVARRAPGAHDPRIDPGGDPAGAGHRGLPRPSLRGTRARGGSVARPRARPRRRPGRVGGRAAGDAARRGVLALIGNTPLVRLESFDTGPCELLVKLESQNPGGSIKDRIGLAMIEAAEQSGAIRHGSTLVEATAGNTGIGLALVAALKGYRLVLVIPPKMSHEKGFHLRA